MPTTTQNFLTDWEENTVLIELTSINQTILETFKIGTVMIFVYTVNTHIIKNINTTESLHNKASSLVPIVNFLCISLVFCNTEKQNSDVTKVILLTQRSLLRQLYYFKTRSTVFIWNKVYIVLFPSTTAYSCIYICMFNLFSYLDKCSSLNVCKAILVMLIDITLNGKCCRRIKVCTIMNTDFWWVVVVLVGGGEE